MIAIDKKFFDTPFSDEAFGIIFYLVATCKQNEMDTYLTKDIVENILYGGNKRTKAHKDNAAATVRELADNGIIEETAFSSSLYKVDKQTLVVGDKFTCISEEEFNKIAKSNSRTKWGLFHLFAFYVYNFSYKYEFRAGDQPIEYYANVMDLTNVTVIRYTRELELMHLIYVSRFKYNMALGYTPHNICGRYADHQKIADYVPAQNDKAKMANWKRMVAQRYSSFVKNPDAFTKEEREQLIKEVNQYNYVQRQYHNEDRCKDTSVFNLT